MTHEELPLSFSGPLPLPLSPNAFLHSFWDTTRLEGMNNKVRLISHRAYGFHSAESLIAMIYLCCSNITLPQLQLS